LKFLPILKKGIVFVLLIVCFSTFANAYTVLTAGLLVGLFGLTSKSEFLKSQSSLWLKISIVLLGFTIPSELVLHAGIAGIVYSSISVAVTLLLGFGIIRLLNLKSNASILINIGTAICGASAIGSISQIIGSDEEDTSLALIVVLLLNSIAVFFFPTIGHWLHLSSYQFGVL